MSEKMDIPDIGKVYADLRSSAAPFILSLSRIAKIVGIALDDIKAELERWEDEGGTVDNSEPYDTPGGFYWDPDGHTYPRPSRRK
jgi:hypothetical protein